MLVAAVVGVLLPSCGPGNDPYEPYVPRQPVYDPPPGSLSALLGDTLVFRVFDPKGQPYPAQFLVGDDDVGTRSSYHHRVVGETSVVVRAKLVMDNQSYEGRWPVTGVGLRFYPVATEPWMLVGQYMDFSVRSSNGLEVDAEFLVDGQPAHSGVDFRFHAEETGEYVVRARAWLDSGLHEFAWTLHVPELSAVPSPGAIELVPYEPVRFDVARSDGVVSYANWEFAGIRQQRADWYVAKLEDLGPGELRAVFPFPLGDFEFVWQLVDATPVPSILNVEVDAPVDADHVIASWTPAVPSGDREVAAAYVLAQSDFNFDPSQWRQVPHVVVPHDPSSDTQSFSYAGLPWSSDRVLRVYAQDAAGTVGYASQPVMFRTPDEGEWIDISGNMRVLPWEGTDVTGAGVRVQAGQQATECDAGGDFALSNIFSNGHQSGAITTGSFGIALDGLVIDPLPAASFDLRALMIPAIEIPLRISDTEIATTTLREYLVELTDPDQITPESTFHAWDSYPVTVYVHDYVFEDGANGPVDYAAAFEYAAQAWNAAAGEELLRVERVAVAPSANSPLTGVFYAADIVPGESSSLGETKILRPANGVLYHVDPEWVILRLRLNFIDDWIARLVVAHELGHALFVAHSRDPDDLMFPYIRHDRTWVPVVAPREAYVARFLRHAGPGIRTEWYLPPRPAGTKKGRALPDPPLDRYGQRID